MSSPEKFEDLYKGIERSLTAARSGDQNELGILLNLYRGYLLTIAKKKLDSQLAVKAAPSDVVQQTLLDASQAFSEFQGSEPELRKWLQQILNRNLLDAYRHYRGIEKRDISREVVLADDDEASEPVADAYASEPSPSVLAGNNESAAALQDALNKLPEDQRISIHYRNFKQLSFEEIGNRLGRSPDAARKLWMRAIQNLTQALGSE